jgi:hypothetical protein
MWNLIVCLLFLVIGICEGIYEFKYFKYHKYLVLCTIVRFFVWFSFGFMLLETIKWLCDVKTLIF